MSSKNSDLNRSIRDQKPQQLPTAGHESVTRELMRLLEAREQKGIATYGRSLETFNGRNAPQDLVEELLDAAQYALQWRLERAEIIHVLRGIALNYSPNMPPGEVVSVLASTVAEAFDLWSRLTGLSRKEA